MSTPTRYVPELFEPRERITLILDQSKPLNLEFIDYTIEPVPVGLYKHVIVVPHESNLHMISGTPTKYEPPVSTKYEAEASALYESQATLYESQATSYESIQKTLPTQDWRPLSFTFPLPYSPNDLSRARDTLLKSMSEEFDIDITNYQEYYMDTEQGMSWNIVPMNNDQALYLSSLEIAFWRSKLTLDILLEYKLSKFPCGMKISNLYFVNGEEDIICSSQGLYSVELTNYEKDILEELAEIWGIDVVGNTNNTSTSVSKVKSGTDFGISLNVWITRSLIDVQVDRFPMIYRYPISISKRKDLLNRYDDLTKTFPMTAYSNTAVSTDESVGFRISCLDDLNYLDGVTSSIKEKKLIELPGNTEVISSDLYVTIRSRVIVIQGVTPEDWKRGRLLNQHALIYFMVTGKISKYPVRDLSGAVTEY